MTRTAPPRPRPSASLLVVPLVAALLGPWGLACDGSERTRTTAEVHDLFPAASIATEKGERHRVRLMAEAKTHRLSLLSPGETLAFEGLDLPGDARVEASVRVLDAPPATREPLVAVAAVRDANGDWTRGRAVLRPREAEPGDPWMPLALGLAADAPVERIELSFEREDLARHPAARLAVLRPLARFELERPVPRAGSDRPPRRVVLVTTDTLRADVLGCYGGEARTPALDDLARESVLFERCFSAANVTNPSHYSIFTSLHPTDHRVLDNFTRLAPEVPTMLEPLRAAGVRTAAFVSSFNFQPEKSDLHERFDELHPCRVYFERRAEDVNAELLPWLGEHADEDFLVWAHYFDPHMPYAPPPPWDRAYPREGGERIDLPIDYKGNLDWFSASRDLGHYRALYLGEVSYLDHHLGELFRRLRDLGIFDTTTVVVVSDHGEALGEHGVYCEHASLHDEVTRVPLLVKPAAPSGIDAPVRVAGLASTVDLYPTLFELLDLALPGGGDGLRGRSLVPLMRGGGDVRESAFSAFARGSQASLRTADHRFLLGLADEELFPRFAIRAGRRQLLELPAPGEGTDVLAERPELARELEAGLRAVLEDARDYESVPVDSDAAREMEKLGYTRGE